MMWSWQSYVFAAPQQNVEFSASYQSRSDTVSAQAVTNRPKIKSKKETLSYGIENLSDMFGVNAAVIADQPDYASIEVMDRQSEKHTLKEQGAKANELSLRLGGQVIVGTSQLNISGQSHVTSSPYATRSLGVNYLQTFFAQTTNAGAGVNCSRQEQPESYYTDNEFRKHKRVTTIYGCQYSSSVEQAVTENWKVYGEVNYMVKPDVRPRAAGGVFKTGYSFTGSIFGQLEAKHMQELKPDPLYDDRGYFTLQSLEASIIFEPMYDLLLSLGGGPGIEIEEKPATDERLRVGSDQFAASAKYKGSGYEVSVSARYAITNRDTRDLAAQGGIKWLF